MVDAVVHRRDLKATIARLCRQLMRQPTTTGDASLQPAA